MTNEAYLEELIYKKAQLAKNLHVLFQITKDCNDILYTKAYERYTIMESACNKLLAKIQKGEVLLTEPYIPDNLTEF